MWLPLLLLGLFQPLMGYQIDWNKLERIARGKVEVKAFVTEDIPLIHNLEMKHIPGADPELVLFSSEYEELESDLLYSGAKLGRVASILERHYNPKKDTWERIPLSAMKRDEINQLVKDLGFYRQNSRDEPVPPEFEMAPARTARHKTLDGEDTQTKHQEENKEDL